MSEPYDPKDQLRMVEEAFPDLVRDKPQIRWRDGAGRVHRVITTEQAPGHFVAWTACKFDVGIAETYKSAEAVTCPLCFSGESWGGKWAERNDLERFM